jgi:voltage-gated potassium channel
MQKPLDTSLYVRRELFIMAITAASVILSILLFAVKVSNIQLIIIYIIDMGVTIILLYDFLGRFKKSKDHRKFILLHSYEIPALIPLLFFGIIENDATIMALFRAIKIVGVFRLLRLLRLFSLFKIARYLKASGFAYLVILLVVSVIFGAIGMFVVEEGNSDSNINNFGDALWFSITTITISGFGDMAPTSIGGRVIATILIVVGLTTILGFIASFGTTLMEKGLRKRRIAHDLKDSLKERIDILESIHHTEVNSMIEEIRELHKNIYNQDVGCIECGFIYPANSVYCNKCGERID